MKPYAASLRAIFQADNEVIAHVIAEQIRQNGERDLQLEDGDSIDVSTVIPYGLGVSRQELSTILRAARNILIETKIKQCFDLARELDRVTWILEHRAEDHFDAAGWEPGDFMDVVEKILKGEIPDA